MQSNYQGYENGIKIHESNLFCHKYTSSQTILKTSMLRTILPTGEFYSIVGKILAREIVLRAANSKASLLETTIPCCYKLPVCALEPIIGQNVNSRGKIAIYNKVFHDLSTEQQNLDLYYKNKIISNDY